MVLVARRPQIRRLPASAIKQEFSTVVRKSAVAMQCKQLCGWPKNQDRQTERARASPPHAHAGVLTSVGRWGESNGQVKGKWDGALVDGNKLHILRPRRSPTASTVTTMLGWITHTMAGSETPHAGSRSRMSLTESSESNGRKEMNAGCSGKRDSSLFGQLTHSPAHVPRKSNLLARERNQ